MKHIKMNFTMNLHSFSFLFLERVNIFYLKKGEKHHVDGINSCNTWWLLYPDQEREGACSLYKHRYVLSCVWFLLNIVYVARNAEAFIQ